jgi:hypothetical protein
MISHFHLEILPAVLRGRIYRSNLLQTLCETLLF